MNCKFAENLEGPVTREGNTVPRTKPMAKKNSVTRFVMVVTVRGIVNPVELIQVIQ
jgi:hypothetical protein